MLRGAGAAPPGSRAEPGGVRTPPEVGSWPQGSYDGAVHEDARRPLTGSATPPARVLMPDEWRKAQAVHVARVEPHVGPHLARREEARRHPVEDFLFVYYSHSPGKLRRWHPGGRVALVADEDGRTPIVDDRYTRRVTTDDGPADILDLDAFLAARDRTVTFVRALLSATLARPAHLGCFGLHEWAMVYRLQPGQQRHEDLPLRLSQAETDAVVDAADIRCTHFDAYRFFTPDAVERNTVRPTRERQVDFEQPACLHAGMDVYKWAHKLWPLVSSDLVLDAFELAKEIRALDMEASPYDVRPLGYGVVPIETPRGRAEYVRRQRDFATRSQDLRRRLLDVLGTL